MYVPNMASLGCMVMEKLIKSQKHDNANTVLSNKVVRKKGEIPQSMLHKSSSSMINNK